MRAPVGPGGNSVLGTGQNPEDRPNDARKMIAVRLALRMRGHAPLETQHSFLTQGLGRGADFCPLQWEPAMCSLCCPSWRVGPCALCAFYTICTLPLAHPGPRAHARSQPRAVAAGTLRS